MLITLHCDLRPFPNPFLLRRIPAIPMKTRNFGWRGEGVPKTPEFPKWNPSRSLCPDQFLSTNRTSGHGALDISYRADILNGQVCGTPLTTRQPVAPWPCACVSVCGLRVEAAHKKEVTGAKISKRPTARKLWVVVFSGPSPAKTAEERIQ